MFYIKKTLNTVEYFDSLGKKPKKAILKYLFSQNIKCVYSTKRLQNYNTNTCGLYCLFYSYYSCRSCDLESIVECYTDDLKKNERIVKNFTIMYLKSHL